APGRKKFDPVPVVWICPTRTVETIVPRDQSLGTGRRNSHEFRYVTSGLVSVTIRVRHGRRWAGWQPAVTSLRAATYRYVAAGYQSALRSCGLPACSRVR